MCEPKKVIYLVWANDSLAITSQPQLRGYAGTLEVAKRTVSDNKDRFVRMSIQEVEVLP